MIMIMVMIITVVFIVNIKLIIAKTSTKVIATSIKTTINVDVMI